MIQIRLAEDNDSHRIIEFQIEMAMETEGLTLTKNTVSEGVKSVFNDPSKGEYFVVEGGNIIIASLLLTPEWSDWRNSWVMWIQSVYVIPNMRKKGVFRALFQHIDEYVKSRKDIAGVRLYVDITNKNARNVYKQLGMNGDHYQLFESMKFE